MPSTRRVKGRDNRTRYEREGRGQGIFFDNRRGRD
jgi:hypothetical protein